MSELEREIQISFLLMNHRRPNRSLLAPHICVIVQQYCRRHKTKWKGILTMNAMVQVIVHKEMYHEEAVASPKSFATAPPIAAIAGTLSN